MNKAVLVFGKSGYFFSSSFQCFYYFLRKKLTMAMRMTDPSRETSMVGMVMASLMVPTWKMGLRKNPARKEPAMARSILRIRLEESLCKIFVASQPINAATIK